MDIPHIPKSAGEKETLVAFLDYQRAVMIDKASDLTQEQWRQRLEPSTMTLGGMIYHLAVVEESWFADDFAGEGLGEPWASVDWEADRDWEWNTALTMDPEAVLDAYRRAIDRSNEIVTAAESLDQLSVKTHPRTGEHWSLRWILVHMIEETARHAGHADLIRESIDGSTGDFRSEG
ncbi:MAG: DinB family protein [Actinomycetota bacterium]